MKQSYKIMIIDDNPKNLKILGEMLGLNGYEIYSFNNGETAYKAAQKNIPDLILLDICMPVIDGYELCSIFKSNKILKGIPIIFLSALNSTEDKVNAFKKGGADYITKPFQIEEIEVRVKTHLKISEMQKMVEKENERLEKMVTERTKELSEVYKKLRSFDKVKSNFINQVSTEIQSSWSSVWNGVENLFSGSNKKSGYDEMKIGKNRIENIINDAAILNKIEFYEEKPKMERVVIEKIIEETAEKKIKVEKKLSDNLEKIELFCSKELLKKAIEIVVKFAENYCKEERINLIYKREAGYIYSSFILRDFFLENDEIFEFVAGKTGESESQTTISNILADKIVNLFNGELYIEKIDKNRAAITLKLPEAGEDKNEQGYDS